MSEREDRVEGGLLHFAVEASFVESGDEGTFGEFAFDGELAGFGLDFGAGDAWDFFERGFNSLDAFATAEMGAADGGTAEFALGGGGFGSGDAFTRARVTGVQESGQRLLGSGRVFRGDGHGFAIDFSGSAFDGGHGFGDAVFAAAAAVMHAIQGDRGIRQSGSSEADQGEEGQERVFHERE